ncbi:unnamed protein product [Adineta ricciae]|uniref:Uncharacterized protein n=1 Tax=Adineta ricciae TaxID=249248 RepID=A0A815K405_ADIRI|nr:unnamed protein product [Adineta ricciae]CAF1502643.1 unnamed protein product [Adineta ricciae]
MKINQTSSPLKNGSVLLSDGRTGGEAENLPKEKVPTIVQVLCMIILFIISIAIALPLILKTHRVAPSLNTKNKTKPTTTIYISTTTPTTTATYTLPSNITYDYTNELSYESKIFYRSASLEKQYYEALQISVSISGDYWFASVSDIDTYGYLFYNSFNPLMLCKNYIQEDDDSMGERQFKIQSILEASQTYILVVTTYFTNVTGKFGIISQGPGNVQIGHMNTTESLDYIPLIHPNDSIYAIYNTTAGGDSTSSTANSSIGNYPSNEGPEKAIDNDTSTKYLNSGACGLNTGYYVTLQRGLSLVKTFQICVADDYEERDPTRITLEGSNESGSDLTLGSSWTLIYDGVVAFSMTPPRYSCSLMHCLNNSISYTSYRFLVTEKRSSDNSVQYSEAQLYFY